MAVDLPLVFIVTVLGAKYSRANGAGEMLNVVFTLQSRDVGST